MQLNLKKLFIISQSLFSLSFTFKKYNPVCVMKDKC